MARLDAAGGMSRLLTLLSIVAVTMALYVAKEVLIPLALAVLISFLLAPLVTRVERWGLNRIASVVLVAAMSFAVLGAVGYVVVGQVLEVAEQLPRYEQTIKDRIRFLRGAESGPLTRAAETVQEISKELTVKKPATRPAQSGPDAGVARSTPPPPVGPSRPATPEEAPEQPEKPVPVEVVNDAPTPAQFLRETIGPLLAPLATAGIVVVFVLFMLIQREDLRDRVIRLIGRGQINLTTQALDDASARISRYLLVQLIINVSYGVPVGIGLFLIGLPNAFLWGLLATVLRFVPYVGPIVGAAIPIVLSLAVFEDWTRPLLVVAMFVALELFSNNVMEPWLYSTRTGLSPVAVLVAAVFWTWLWGPLGLLLSTPLTVCLVVTGKYVPQLEFFNILLSDEAVLAPHTRFYQRLLAGDQDEAIELAHEHLERSSLLMTFDEVLVPALRLAEQDRHRGELDPQRQAFLHNVVRELIPELVERHRRLIAQAAQQAEKAPPAVRARGEPERKPGKLAEAPAESLARLSRAAEAPAMPASGASGGPPALPQRVVDVPVLLLPAHDKADQIVALMLAEALLLRGYRTGVLATGSLASEMLQHVEQAQAQLVVISALPPAAVTHALYLCKRLRGRLPHVTTHTGLWTARNNLRRGKERLRAAGSEKVLSTVAEAAEQARLVIQPWLLKHAPPEPSPPPEVRASPP